jgi:RimJ/RimL family protein N-acetyltransferase
MRLVPVTDTDVAVLVRHFTEAQIQRYLRDELPTTYERVNAITSASDRAFDKYGYGIWAMHIAGHSGAIGICGLQASSRGDRVELLFSVRPRYSKHGYAREAAEAVVDYALGVVRLKQVFGVCEADNPVAATILKRLGMRALNTVEVGASSLDFVISSDRSVEQRVLGHDGAN